VNPLSGEGIGTGMISGYIAAQFAAKAIKNQCFTANFLKDYEPLCRHHLKQEIAFVKITDSLKFELWRQPFLNFLVSKHIYPNYFKKNHIKWLETAFTKPIKFEL
jgi:flavin-dependent dehydrogenase